jgi:hypothetical protein
VFCCCVVVCERHLVIMERGPPRRPPPVLLSPDELLRPGSLRKTHSQETLPDHSPAVPPPNDEPAHVEEKSNLLSPQKTKRARRFSFSFGTKYGIFFSLCLFVSFVSFWFSFLHSVRKSLR